MDNLESGLEAILNNPQMMQQIMAIAQNFQTDPTTPPQNSSPPPPLGGGGLDIDFATVQKITSLIGKTGIDADW